jgi:hypothetical protein
VSDLKPEVVSQIRSLMDPQQQLFESTVVSSSRVDAKKKPVRQLQHAPGFPALAPIALVLDNKQSQLWHPPDMPHVMHCERYCFFPRPSMVCCQHHQHHRHSFVPNFMSASLHLSRWPITFKVK